jgi:hypothetical protein
VDPRRGAPLRAALLLGAALFAAALSALPARAEPAFAVRTGYSCSQCHVNRSGGGLRTPFGSLWAQTILPRRLLREPLGGILSADPAARYAVGGDARFQLLSIDARDSQDVFSFEVPEANLYGELRLARERLSLYVDERVGPGGASARELFALASFGAHRGYVKAGKFLPAYGWRLPDDNAHVRTSTGFTYSAPDTGLEVGLEPGRWTMHAAVLNGSGGGSDTDRSKRFTLQAVRRFSGWRAGVSGANNVADSGRTTHAGLLGGGNVGRFAWLAEADWVETSSSAGTERRTLALLEADVLVVRGVNL